ncbi:VOC family protein [Dyella sp.]|uniref:VOC family protein n=1 Tax=Dyella sp. TaxID=1869338 RepID=UPI002ED29D42
MLGDIDALPIVAVSDIGRARHFYESVLGLPLQDDHGEVLVFRTGATALVVYRSDEAGSNRGNAVVWACGEQIDAIVDDLRSKDVHFEHYPQLGLEWRDGVHWAGDKKLVWINDPDNNILHLHSM